MSLADGGRKILARFSQRVYNEENFKGVLYMGAEYELKFRADADCQKSVYTTFPARWQTIRMETTYYDTLSGALSSRKFMLRSRLENNKRVCTLKTPGQNNLRGEWETECDSIAEAIAELCKLGAPEELLSLTAGGVVSVCGARFTRLAGEIAAEGCTLELALDHGILIGGNKTTPLCEVEVELKSGEDADAVAYAQALSRKFALSPQPKSKYRRALDLARSKENDHV